MIAALATIRWFPVDRYLAAGDITPFVRAGSIAELWGFWNHRVSGTGSTSVPISRLIEVAFIQPVQLLGGSGPLAQHLFYAALMAFAAFGAAYLARGFVSAPLAVAAAGMLGAFNPFVLVLLPNPLFILWIGLVATLSGMVVRGARGAPVSPLLFAGATLPVLYLSLNPPLLATSVLTVVGLVAASSILVGAGGVDGPRCSSCVRSRGW